MEAPPVARDASHFVTHKIPREPLSNEVTTPIIEFAHSDDFDLAICDVSWVKYALHYDKMCSVNPAYEANIERVKELVDEARPRIPTVPLIYDFGAGTGNACVQIASLFPSANIRHIDNNAGMNVVARQKVRRLFKLNNVQIVAAVYRTLLRPPVQFPSDFAICLHAAYTVDRPG